MFNETEVLMQLKNLLGKEFTVPELCESYGYDTREFAEYFFELDKENKISFVLNAKGMLRLAHVMGEKAQIEQIKYIYLAGTITLISLIILMKSL